MENKGIRDNVRLAANPTAVARQAHVLPDLALCLIRLLDGRRTLADALRYSPVDEDTARAVIRRCCELGLVEPVAQPETRVAELSPALRDWLHEAGMRLVNEPDDEGAGRDEDPAAELAAALREDVEPRFTTRPADALAEGAVPYEGLAAEAVVTDSGPTGSERIPSSLHEALVAHLEPRPGSAPEPMPTPEPEPRRLSCPPPIPAAATRPPRSATPIAQPSFSAEDLAFFDSYVPEEPMLDTFSDLISAPTRRR